MYSINFIGRTLESLLGNTPNSDQSSIWYNRVGVILCTGGIPEGDVPEFNLGTGIEDTEEFSSNLLPVFESSVADLSLYTRQVLGADGNHYVEFKPISSLPIHTYGWTARNNRWERYPDMVRLTKGLVNGEHGTGSHNLIRFPSESMNLSGTGHIHYRPYITPPQVEDRECIIELSTEKDITVEKLDMYVASTYDVYLDYWDSETEAWIELGEFSNDYRGLHILDNPVTTSKWRFRGTTSSSAHYVSVRKFMFVSDATPTFEPPKTVTHAYIFPKIYTQSAYKQFEESVPTVMVSVGSLTSTEPLVLLDSEIGDNKEAQFIAMALSIEELESDKI